ncbi:MAG TPA: hypothetical protein VFA59_17970 [Vicinamibacterales bacterium]|nr:hypothetical protein [Vicinamibacterales bacterium]
MTRYVIRDRANRRFRTGDAYGWSPHVSDARVFDFATIALLTAARDCAAPAGDYDAEPIYQAEQQRCA